MQLTTLEMLSEEPTVLVRLACSRHGHAAAREVVEVLDDPDRTHCRFMKTDLSLD